MPVDASTTETDPVGLIGLGNMGRALAANLLEAGVAVLGYDAAGPGRAPEGAAEAGGVDEVARRCATIVLSLPDAQASASVAEAIVAVPGRACSLVVDTSMIGVSGAEVVSGLLEEVGIEYLDAPVSGGVAGARARTLMIMVAGTPDASARAAPVLVALSDRRRAVGERPGMAQALKLANNFLSATALAATSEAIAFGCSVGLEMETMLDVLNMSSGQSAATTDKFPNHVATGRYASGFTNTLMSKDLSLYLQATEHQRTPSVLGRVTAHIWNRFATDEPGRDFTRIFPFVEGS